MSPLSSDIQIKGAPPVLQTFLRKPQRKGKLTLDQLCFPIRILSSLQTPNCPLCKNTFSSQQSVLEHTFSRHMNCKFQCQLCSLISGSVRQVRAHITRQHPESLKSCELCKKRFISRHTLDRHVRRSHKKVGLLRGCEAKKKYSPHIKMHRLSGKGTNAIFAIGHPKEHRETHFKGITGFGSSFCEFLIKRIP